MLMKLQDLSAGRGSQLLYKGKGIWLDKSSFDEEKIAPKISLFQTYLYKQVMERDSNFIGIVEGKSGTGKSVSTIALLERWSLRVKQPFSIAGNVFTDATGLMQKLSDLEQRKAQGEDVRGTAIVLDEAGIVMDNRAWQSHIHKILNDTIEVFRYLNLVFFITAPYRNRIDSKLRDLAHGTFRPVKVVQHEYSIVKFYLNDKNWKGEDIYPRLRAQHHGWTFVVSHLRVKKPSLKLMNDYKAMQEQFKGKTITEGYRKLLPKHKTMNGTGEKKPLNDKQRKIYMYAKQGLTREEIAAAIGMSPTSVRGHLKLISAMGYLDD